MTTTDRFWARVDAGGDCWLWTAARDRDGYGRFGRHGSAAHRFAYQELVGPSPEGLVIDHLCRNPPCVNPDHMEPVTIGENVRRGMRLRAGYCKAGHRMDEVNTLIHRTKRGVRHQCRTCWAGYFRKYRAQKRAALAA
jgi:hypothetical protein